MRGFVRQRPSKPNSPAAELPPCDEAPVEATVARGALATGSRGALAAIVVVVALPDDWCGGVLAPRLVRRRARPRGLGFDARRACARDREGERCWDWTTGPDARPCAPRRIAVGRGSPDVTAPSTARRTRAGARTSGAARCARGDLDEQLRRTG